MVPDLGISVTLLRPLADLLAQLDVDPQAFLSSLGVDKESSSSASNAYVSGERVDRELAAIAAQRRDPAFALTLARLSLGRPLGLFGHLVWLSGTMRDALTRATRFYGVVTRRVTLSLEQLPEEGVARICQHAVKGSSRGRILTELPFASMALRARAATDGRFALKSVHFAHAGEPVRAYEEVFGAPVLFGAALDVLTFDEAMLDLRIAGADSLTSAALEDRAIKLAEDVTRHGGLLARVQEVVAGTSGAPLLEEIASKLGMSPRTLRRHLEQEHTTLREIVDRVRRERADVLLANGMPVKEVAFALGFSEPSAFSRAYKRWTGRAPRATPR